MSTNTVHRLPALLCLAAILALALTTGGAPLAAQQPLPPNGVRPGHEKPVMPLAEAVEWAPSPTISSTDAEVDSPKEAGIAAVLATATQVAAGHNHTCALTNGGGVKCWGRNEHGQLGDGTTTNHIVPDDVIGLTSGVASVVANYDHTCALTDAAHGSGVKCWGYNAYGQLGDGTTIDRLTPVTVSGLSNGVASVVAGTSHTCAVMDAVHGSSAKCWGNNDYGQLGDGSTSRRTVPVNVVGLGNGGVAMAAGSYHTCASTTSGVLMCWGYNYFGQLGDGTTTDRLTPVTVNGLGNGLVGVTAGGYHTCALTTEHGVECWGWNSSGQLGDGTTTTRTNPGTVGGLANITAVVVAGGYHTCAVVAGGGVKCWGKNNEGELGDGTTTSRTIPVDVSGVGRGIVAVAADMSHTCAVTLGGGVKCWGANGYGQLGNGTTTARTTPVDVDGLAVDIAAVTAGGYHTCALTTSGSAKCWGNNLYGQLGAGTFTDHYTPVTVSGSATGIADVTAGDYHTCALTTSGGVKCWGDNGYGQLGDGTFGKSSTPVAVNGLSSGVAAVAVGGYHTCALTTGGGVKCWGRNDHGQLGDGTWVIRYTPVVVSGLSSGVVAVVTGWGHTCALMDAARGGGVKCWGFNGYGQLGDGTTTDRLTPVAISGLSNDVASVVAGGHHTCALTTAHRVKCWGRNEYGQVGDGTTISRSIPVGVGSLPSNVGSVTGGLYHTCAVMTGEGIKCWGDNSFGQLGDGTTTGRAIPVDVSGLGSSSAAITAGNWHSCALTVSGRVKCWGNSGSGQLGIDPGWTPVDVIGFGPATYTISGRVTESGGFTGIPGVTVWADSTHSTTTNANGDYTLTGLPAGTYVIRPEKAPYAFSPASRTVTVPADQTGVDFRSIAITKIQVNQVLGNTTNYVAGKDTVIQVMLSDRVPYDPMNQQVVVKRNGAYITTLKPIKPAFPTQTLNFWGKMGDCGNWQQGSYTFEATVNGAYRVADSLQFHNRATLRILAVPVRIRADGQDKMPSERRKSAYELIAETFPIASEGIAYTQALSPLEARDLDLILPWNRVELWARVAALQPLLCGRFGQPDCYDLIIAVIPQVSLCVLGECIEGWTVLPPAVVAMDSPNLLSNVAHELGHLIGSEGLQPGLGDEYQSFCSAFRCSANPPPASYSGTDGRSAFCGGFHCSDPDVQAWDSWRGSRVVATQDAPYEVSGRGALDDQLSFMGAAGAHPHDYWVTPRSYDFLFAHLLPDSATVASAPEAVERIATVSGWITADGHASLNPVYHSMSSPPPAMTGPYTVEILSTQNAILASQGFDVSFTILTNPPEQVSEVPFRAEVRLPQESKTIRLMHGGTVLVETQISASAPSLSVISPVAGEIWPREGNRMIRWQGNDLDGDTLHYTVLYHQGAGEWSVLGADLTTNELTVDAAGLPGGTAAQVQVLATDGINTTTAESGLFTVGRKGPEAFITYPAEGARFMPGASFFLQGTAYDLEDGTLPDSAYRWRSNRDGDLGTGATNLVILSSGPHVLTLTVTDSDGNTAVKTIRLSAGSQQFMPLIYRSQ